MPDVPAPTLRAYPKATVVAEKLHAVTVTVLGMTNTRMKDFANDATKQMQWRAFLSKNKLEHMELRDVISAIRERAMRLGIPRQ